MMASTEVIIDAPIGIVWEIMTNVKKYPDWNTFVVSVDYHYDSEESSMKVGDSMRLNVIFPKHKESGKMTHSKERILVFDPPTSSSSSSSTSTMSNHHDDSKSSSSARWEYKFVSWLHYCHLVTATRIQELTEIQSSKGGKKTMTKYYTEESFGGCLAWFVPLKDVQEGFEAQAQALKAHAERQTHQ